MASSFGNTAKPLQEPEADREPSMEEILASIRQIIADDEQSEDGSSERDRYEHPTDHSNINDASEASAADVMEAELNGQRPADGAGISEARDDESGLTVEQRAEAIRAQISAAGQGLSAEDRLEQHRVRGKSHLESLAETLADQNVTSSSASGYTAAAAAAAPVMPTTQAIADKMAETMMNEKSAEIEGLLGELMRPIVRTWLANNLPSLVERLVREEIENASRSRRAS